jgi:hypothetical protein
MLKMKATTGASTREVVKAQAVVRGHLVRRKYAPLRTAPSPILFYFYFFLFIKFINIK